VSVVVNQYLSELTGNLVLSLGNNPGGWEYHLYVNLYSPSPLDSAASYLECTIPGYGPIGIVPAEWTGPALSGAIAQWVYPKITWTFDAYTSSQQTIFGYYVTDASGKVLFSELFPAPFPVPPQGGSLPLIPYWTNEQCPNT